MSKDEMLIAAADIIDQLVRVIAENGIRLSDELEEESADIIKLICEDQGIKATIKVQKCYVWSVWPYCAYTPTRAGTRTGDGDGS